MNYVVDHISSCNPNDTFVRKKKSTKKVLASVGILLPATQLSNSKGLVKCKSAKRSTDSIYLVFLRQKSFADKIVNSIATL